MPTSTTTDLSRRIVTIGEYAARADALTEMITTHLQWDDGDVAGATHSFLLTDQLVESIINQSGGVCSDAHAVFLDIIGIDAATWDEHLERSDRGEAVPQAEQDRFESIRRSIPDVNDSIETLGTANDEFRASFEDAADDALARITMAAVMTNGHIDGPNRVVAVEVSGLTTDERLIMITWGDVSWNTGLGVIGADATVAGYLCAERGAVDLGAHAPLADVFAFSSRIKDALDNGVSLDDAYGAAYMCAASAPINQMRNRLALQRDEMNGDTPPLTI